MILRIAHKTEQDGLFAEIKRISTLAWEYCLAKEKILSPVDRAMVEVMKNEGFVVVQLGAYIGDSPNDPLFKRLATLPGTFKCKAVLVEPNRYFFDQLVKNYCAKKFVACENLAVASEVGEVTLYTLGVNPVDYGYPEWLSQLSSLRQDRMGELWDRYEQNTTYQAFYRENLIEEKVKGVTLNHLLADHEITNIDLLQIDVEGSELEILESIDFELTNIRFLNYESVLLGDELHNTKRLLNEKGYLLIDHGQETFAFRAEDRELFDHWLA